MKYKRQKLMLIIGVIVFFVLGVVFTIRVYQFNKHPEKYDKSTQLESNKKNTDNDLSKEKNSK